MPMTKYAVAMPPGSGGGVEIGPTVFWNRAAMTECEHRTQVPESFRRSLMRGRSVLGVKRGSDNAK
jgi:hypothetical protein